MEELVFIGWQNLCRHLRKDARTIAKPCPIIKVSQGLLCQVNKTGARFQVVSMDQECVEGPDLRGGRANRQERTKG